MKKILLAAAALVVASAAPAGAQLPASHREAAMDLLVAMRVPETLQASMNAALQSQLQGNPQMRAVEPVLRDFLAKYITWDALKDQYADIYANAFSEDELREMAAFYRTDTGQKLARLTPALLRQGIELGDRAVQQHLPELQQMIEQRLTTAQPAKP
jgi:uncharacterized protein